MFSGAGEGREMSGAVGVTGGAPREAAALVTDLDGDVGVGSLGDVIGASVIGVVGVGREATAAPRLCVLADSVSRGFGVTGALSGGRPANSRGGVTRRAAS